MYSKIYRVIIFQSFHCFKQVACFPDLLETQLEFTLILTQFLKIENPNKIRVYNKKRVTCTIYVSFLVINLIQLKSYCSCSVYRKKVKAAIFNILPK